MHRLVVGLVALMLASLAVSAHEPTDDAKSLQNDGGVEGDAPDRCEDADPLRHLANNTTLEGLLVPEIDTVDVYTINATSDLVGKRMSVTFLTPEIETGEVEIDVILPGCGLSVLAESDPNATTTATPTKAFGHCKEGDTEDSHAEGKGHGHTKHGCKTTKVPYENATAYGQTVEFSVTSTGLYVVELVYIAPEAEDTVTDMLAPKPAECHDLCRGIIGPVEDPIDYEILRITL